MDPWVFLWKINSVYKIFQDILFEQNVFSFSYLKAVFLLKYILMTIITIT
jgi:hypothetical protein